ncbi:MAG: EAL domain-containing protein [Lachnospiraceae bacterium]|nr:EAL domain-containing protein [Lachnospiraceae bacterium]
MAKKILVVDDSQFNRFIIRMILSESYELIETQNGQEAMDVLYSEKEFISAILLDIVMPVMDGYRVLELLKEDKGFEAIPVIVMTSNGDVETELKALKLGANDFLVKPFEAAIIKQRIKNIIQLSETASLRIAAERDSLTGIYNKATFYDKVHELLLENTDVLYDLICIDVERFKVINDLFGVLEGDKLLCFIAEKFSEHPLAQVGIFGRLDSDHFAICTPRKDDYEECLVENAEKIIATYPLDMKIFLCFGVYMIDDHNQPVNIMCDRANLAADSIKGNYAKRCAYYHDDYRASILKEQEILDDMQSAFRENQFEVFLQPKCSLLDGSITGFEALARWNHPKKGCVAPNEFIPIFEHNGCIQRLDFYIWNRTCEIIRNWIDEGKDPLPVSVNVSRVDFYNPQLCQLIVGLTNIHSIQPSLLELEITETAYTDNPKQLCDVILQLQEHGFTILMDDFGSGYSSLNMLKDIPVDVLKIDLNFLADEGSTGRGANILSSVIRMAKRLKLPVIAEGVETKEQAAFLRSIGCQSAQGYYFYKPMNIESIAKLYDVKIKSYKKQVIKNDGTDIEKLLYSDNYFCSFLGNMIGCVGFFELQDDNLEGIRVNDSYFKVTNISIGDENVLSWVLPEDKGTVLSTLHRCEKSGTVESCQVRCKKPDEKLIWINANARCILYEGYHSIFCIAISDISEIKKSEQFYCAEVNKLNAISELLNEQLLEYDVNTDVLRFLSKNFSKVTANSIALDFRKNIISIGSIHPNYMEVCVKSLDEAVSKVCSGVLKLKLLISSEEYQLYRISYASVANECGKIIKVVGRMENIEKQTSNIM